MGWHSNYFKNFEIFKIRKFTLDHLLILTQPVLLSPWSRRSKEVRFSGLRLKSRPRFNLLRLSLPERRSATARFMFPSHSRVRFLRSVALWSSSRLRSNPLLRSIPFLRSRPFLLSDLWSRENLRCRFECCPFLGRWGLFILELRAKVT